MAETVPIIVNQSWLADHRADVTLVDVRERWEYESIGHIPGAVNVPFETIRDGGGDEGQLPGADRFGAVMGSVGISPTDRIVAYDDEHGVYAARLLVTAMLYGHEQWHLLEGDFSAWQRSHETTTEPPTIVETTYEATIPADRPLVDAARVEAAVDDPNAVLVDTRSPEEYRTGHITGAVNLDWRDLLDPETRGLKPRMELKRILNGHGVRPDKRIVLYCNTARRISHTYVVLRHLGFETVDFYEGSLTDWSTKGLELEEGETPAG